MVSVRRSGYAFVQDCLHRAAFQSPCRDWSALCRVPSSKWQATNRVRSWLLG